MYGLLLDRMSLSRKNNWFDNQNRVYIVFPIEDIKEQLGICGETAVKLLKELDDKKETQRSGYDFHYLCYELYC